MSPTTAYTPLESLLLFQSLLSHGIEAAAFLQVSQTLKNNALIRNDTSYDVTRLTPESLQQLFLQLLREELKSEADNVDKPDGALSPGSRKRKLAAAPLPTLRDARDHIEKLPLLVERLYARYRAHTIEEIRADERRIELLREQIRELEFAEKQDATRHGEGAGRGTGAAGNGAPAAVEPKDYKLPNGMTSAVPTGTTDVGQSVSVTRPLSPEDRSRVSALAGPVVVEAHGAPLRQPSPGSAVTTGLGPPGSPKPPNGTPQVLQAPQVGRGFSPRPPQANIAPGPDGLQRPEVATRAKHSPTIQPAQAQAPGNLKWEPPYQPPRQQHGGVVPPHYSSAQRPLSLPPAQPSQQGSQQWTQPTGSPYLSPRPLIARLPSPVSQGAQQASLPVLLPPQYAGHPPASTQPGPTFSSASDSSDLQPQRRQGALTEQLSGPGRIVPSQPQQRHGSNPPSALGPAQPSTSTTPTPPPLAAAGRPAQPPPASVAVQDPTLQPAVSTPTAPFRGFRLENLPSTPFSGPQFWDVHGSGTKWKSGQPTPSTPRPDTGDMPSPAFELVSPVLQAAQLPPLPSRETSSKKSTPQPAMQKLDTSVGRPRGRPPKGAPKLRDASGTPGSQPHRLRSTRSHDPGAEEDSPVVADEPVIKNEDDTPRPPDEVADTTAESTPARQPPPSLRGAQKRKRRPSSPTPLATPLSAATQDIRPPPPPPPPNHVLWTRGFNRVAKPVLDQIKSHKFANIFATPVREKVAPGYNGIVLRPQDLKSIQTAVTQGSKAAALAAQQLPGGDPGGTTLWLPVGEVLVPPLGIINSAQLEREILHMFANAIMYNLDPNRGPGPAFLAVSTQMVEEEPETAGGGGAADAVHGYKMDENGVVNDTRSMFLDVQQLLTNLRSAEAHGGAAPAAGLESGLGSGAPPTGTTTRQHSAVPGGGGSGAAGGGTEATPLKDEPSTGASGGGLTAGIASGAGEDDGEDQTATEAEASSVSGTVKRRRITRGM